MIIVAIKPQNLDDIAASASAAYRETSLIISILAGITIKRIQSVFGKKARIVRTMPNLGLVAGAGATGICKNRHVTSSHMSFVKKLFSCGGVVAEVQEKYIDVVTAISGSGPAYYFYLTELLIREATRHGLAPKTAQLLAEATLHGSSTVLSCSQEDAAVWRSKVTSPGGTTAAALSVLSGATFQKLFQKAIQKAIKRAKELSK
jgi:pyrroline-5-carboxylate reductase